MFKFLTNPFIMGGILLGVGVYLILKDTINIRLLSTRQKEDAVNTAAEEEGDIFDNLSKELVDEEEVERKLESLLD